MAEETNNGLEGGLLQGDKHTDPSGGIEAVVVDTNQPVLLESGEAIISAKAVEKHHELLSEINESAGGAPIMDPNKAELQKGIEIEQEHKETLQKLASGKIDVSTAIEQTAKDHLKEDPQYYSKLKEMENNPIKIGGIVINNEASNDERTWIIKDIKDGTIVLSHSPKFVSAKNDETVSFERFLQLYNDRIISIPVIDTLNLENFEAKKMIVELAVTKLDMDDVLADLSRRMEDALAETKRARAELAGLTTTEGLEGVVEEFEKGGNIDEHRIPSLEKHWKGLSKKQVEDYAEYLGNLKMMWNKKEVSLTKPQIKEIVAYQIFISENYPEFNHYLNEQTRKGKEEAENNKHHTLSILKELLPTLRGKEKKECEAKIKELEK